MYGGCALPLCSLALCSAIIPFASSFLLSLSLSLSLSLCSLRIFYSVVRLLSNPRLVIFPSLHQADWGSQGVRSNLRRQAQRGDSGDLLERALFSFFSI